ncbi:MAG: hypothetical protein RSD85_00040 [Erysipelotrichaceae bacterium]
MIFKIPKNMTPEEYARKIHTLSVNVDQCNNEINITMSLETFIDEAEGNCAIRYIRKKVFEQLERED